MINILLIEDNEVDRFIVEKQLAYAGIDARLTAVSSGREGFEALTEQFQETGHLPDVILVDRYMPIMDGIQFVEAFANLNMRGKEDVKLFILTSSIDPALWNTHTRSLITAVIQKPVTRDIVTAIANRLHDDSLPPASV